MTGPSQQPSADDGTNPRRDATSLGQPTLAEDLLLLLFQPDSGTIAGENTLFYVLAGAVLADLALAEQVRTETTATGSLKVQAAPGRGPHDAMLREAWDYLTEKPRGVQGVLAAIGPPLRARVLDRLIERGEIRCVTRKVLGLFASTTLSDAGTGRRTIVLGQIRDVLVDGGEPTPRVAALAALLWGSGTLPQFGRDIPWTSTVLTRAQELQQGNWGARAAAEAVTRTMAAIIASSVFVANAAQPRT